MHYSTKVIELGSCAFRQPQATSHCRFIHGYQLKAKFWFEAEHLDENNWVVDFGSLKELKQLLKNQFDHTTCISKYDPHADKFLELEKAGVCDLRIMDGVGIEKFAEFCFDAANNFVGVITKLRCRCTQVEVFEHQDNSAVYKAPTPVIASAEAPPAAVEPTVEQPGETTSVAQDTTKPVAKEKKPETEPDVKKPYNQTKTVGKWVDPKYSGKTTNTWLF